MRLFDLLLLYIRRHSTIYTLLLLPFHILIAQKTQHVFLSGIDAEHTVEWDFMCTAGRNSGVWSKIKVPSCWEQEGYGVYNYGRGKLDERENEIGYYKHSFIAESEWKEKFVNIVFEGVMTDCEVKINGKLAGPIHQGAFYRFKYDITKLIHFDNDNLLEITVKKDSDNKTVSEAERNADYWIFGGIFRPVYLEILPKEHIERIDINAKADGYFEANVLLGNIKKTSTVSVTIENENGQKKDELTVSINKNENVVTVTGQTDNIKPWTPEHPNLYLATFELKDKNGNLIHTVMEKIGFRTVEVKEQDGIYVNGVRIKFKGVNRHTFHPEYARTSSKNLSIADVNRIKDMNMNAVRMAHYPPEKHFLEVCDSLGLFVINELAGWHRPPYDSVVGRKLLKEMIERDMNHPSIVLWDNGNEGGWNTTYDADFKKLDIQKREVLHPWAVHEKTNTAHYINYNYLSLDNFSQRKIFFPTEFLHGLYDGGHGAGLEDYWKLMYSNPLCAGGFLWSFADECVMRSDIKVLDGDGNNAPDGILGPYGEKEGSFYAIKEIWSPLYFEKRYITDQFNGIFNIENRYHYTNLNKCNITYKWLETSKPTDSVQNRVLANGNLYIDLPPGQHGKLKVPLPQNWKNADVLNIEATDTHDRLIYSWSWPVKSPKKLIDKIITKGDETSIAFEEKDDKYIFSTQSTTIEISKENGILLRATNSKGNIPINGGPFIHSESIKCNDVRYYKRDNAYIVKALFDKNYMEITWIINSNGLVDLDVNYQLPKEMRDYAGVSFLYSEKEIKGVRFMGNGPYRVWRNRMAGATFGIWEKEYNNTITGHLGYIYPEFKGYYSNLYWVRFQNRTEQNFTVYCKSEDIFLRLFTPESPPKPGKTIAKFPAGEISFMHGISPVGSKFKNANEMGPQSQLYQYRPKRVDGRSLNVSLTFDFRDPGK